MSQSQFSQVLSQFGQQLGLPGLEPNALGAVTLRVDGDVDFNLLVSPDGQTVTAFVELGELDDDVGADVLRAMLQANYFWMGTGGATLGLQPGTGVAVLAQQFAVSTLSPGDLEQVMKRFLEFVDRGLSKFLEPVAENVPGGGSWPVRV